MFNKTQIGRRSFLAGTAALAGSTAVGQAFEEAVEIESEISQTTKRNASAFRTLDWKPYFTNLKN
ncbi:MAG: L,D-transpeptidase, partial [Planktomarina sp.]